MPTLEVPTLPETAPFTPEQRAWLNGYLRRPAFGQQASRACRRLEPKPNTAAVPLLLLYGSQTGTAEALAGRLAREAQKHNFESRAVSMADFATINFAEQKRIAIVTSTYGEGDMPDNAQAFWEMLTSDAAPRLDHCEFSVLALGDSNYAQFCEAGKNFDRRLEQLGAKRVRARVDCEVDHEADATRWFKGFDRSALRGSSGESAGSRTGSGSARGRKNRRLLEEKSVPARLKTNRRLNGEGSAKDTRHLEIVLEGSGFTYDVGDALGVVPTNCAEFVQEILDTAELDGEQAVLTPLGVEKPLRLALATDFDLKPFVTALPAAGISPAELTAPLRKLQPRLYSISSSPKAHPGEVHLTVAVVRFDVGGKRRKGTCSTFLADRVGAETPVPVFVHPSPGFKIPKDPGRADDHGRAVGPGTGIAPFRAFLEERRALGATGRNWLFFGDQCVATDFSTARNWRPTRRTAFSPASPPRFRATRPEKFMCSTG